MRPVVYRLDGRNFECVMADDGDWYEKTFTEVRSAAKKRWRTQLPEGIDDAASSHFDDKKSKVTIRVENRNGGDADKTGGGGRDEYIDNGLKTTGGKISTRRGHDDGRNTTRVDTDRHGGADIGYTVSRRASDESNGTYADDWNAYDNYGDGDDTSDDKSRATTDNNRPRKNDGKNVAVLAAVRHGDVDGTGESDERDDCGGGRMSKDDPPTVLVNNNIRFKFILSSGGALLDRGAPSSSLQATDNKTSPSVTLKIEKLAGDQSTIKVRDMSDSDMNTTRYDRNTDGT